MMKYIVWGAGHRGRVLFDLLGAEKIAAYIDANPEKIGGSYMGCPIISYETYKRQFRQYIIIVSLTFGSAVCRMLEKDHLFYFNIEDCPPEYMGYGLIKAKKEIENFKINLKTTDCILIYGSTLYTIEIYEKLFQKGYKNLHVLFPTTASSSQKKDFTFYFPEISAVEKKDFNADQLLVTDKRFYDEDFHFTIPVLDIVDWSNFIKGYYNQKIDQLKNKFSSKRCFIVATGPSITYEDLDMLHSHNEFCISINTIYKCFEHTSWRPDGYVVLDADGIKEWNDQFYQLSDIQYKFISDAQPYFDYSRLEPEWLVYHSILDSYSIKKMLISDDVSHRLYNGASVIYACMQIAMFLGFKDIYLLGVDFSYMKGKKNHFIDQFEPDDIFDGMTLQNKIQEISYVAFCKAREYADKKGIRIYNATRGGYLEVFERVVFDQLF